MKWGRKKPSSSSSSSSSFSSSFPSFSHVLPASWLSKFKQMSVGGEPKPAKGKPNSVSSSSKFAATEEGRFYAGDDDAFYRLSFGKERVDGKVNRGVGSDMNELDDEFGFPPSSCQSCGSNAARTTETEGIKRFGNMAWDVKKVKEFRRDTEILPERNVDEGEQVTVIKTPRMMSAKDLKFRKRFEEAVEEKMLRLQRVKGEAEQNPTKTGGKITSKVVETRQMQTPEIGRRHQNLSSMNSRNSYSATTDDSAFAARETKESYKLSPETLSSEWRKLKEMKIEELKMKSEKQRKSLYMSRELQQRRRPKQTQVKAFSPRTPTKVEICKIKALEDMKKAKLKMKASKERRMKQTTRLENFAVVKCSLDPEKDFRDSMIEMIMEKRISQPEELEELLACYLTLNSDEYHDLIIKVFRQVWFNLDQDNIGSSYTEFQTEECFQG